MSWLFSQALVAAFLPASCLDGELSAQSSGSPTQLAYLPPDKMTAFSRLSRFGMTYKPLTESRGEELLTSYLAAFPVKTLVQREKVQELTENDQECGNTWRGWLAKYDPDSCLWRTAQCSLLEDLNESLEIFPKSGMTRNGLLWELPMLEPPTRETVFGFSVPTPVSSDATSGAVIGKNDTFYTTSTGLPRKINQNGKDGSVGLARLVQMWPTPQARDYRSGDSPDSPRAQRKRAQGWSPNLNDVVLWPTPTAWDYKSGTGAQDRLGHSPPLSNVIGGTLNPTWVEWLMGWPLEWTDLKPLETDKSHCVQQQHGGC